MDPSLNPQQREAVLHTGGSLLIVAGAGSGKTKTLTHRIAHHIASGVKPEHILAITFTNKAANEMGARIRALLARTTDDGGPMTNTSTRHPTPDTRHALPFIGTFHAWGARLLRHEAKYLGRTPDFSIFDEDDTLRILKSIVKAMNVDAERNKPQTFRSRISRIKNELADPGKLAESNHPGDQLAARVYAAYEHALIENNAFDFDDLLEKVVRLFIAKPEVLEQYRERHQHIFVDEYQDVNAVQYTLVKQLVGKRGTLSVVGDDAQCLLPTTSILTPAGPREIQSLKKNDVVFSASGNGERCQAPITTVHRRHYCGPMVRVTLADGQTLQLTPNHLVFARLQPLHDIYFVYLMYRKDKGFRVGIAKGARWGRRKEQIGLIVRNNQEKADKVWVLRVCPSKNDASYYEYFYAFKYGIPTMVFSAANRDMQFHQSQIDALFGAIDTKERAMKLMAEELLYFSYPHWIPKGTIRHQSRRLRVRLTLFDDRRKSIVHPWGMSRLSVNTKDKKLRDALESFGYKTRKGKLLDWRLEIASLRYDELEQLAQKIESIDAEIELVRSACLTSHKRLFFQPASHLRPSMVVAVNTLRGIEEAVVQSVSIQQYDGFVYDLDVANVHNYIAHNFVVHNSIYAFRGSDFRNFLRFDTDWPNTKVIFLEENYRSTGNIITAASALIGHNTVQKKKNLWTKHENGALVNVVGLGTANDEACVVVGQIATLLCESNVDPDVAILYRTNAQSRPIEYALLKNGIPYRIYGGLRFYDRMEIKDIVCALQYAANPKNTMAAERIKKNFKKKEATALLTELPNFGAQLSLLELLGFILKTTDYLATLKKDYQNAEERIENVNELLSFASTYKDAGLAAFLEQVSLATSSDSANGSIAPTTSKAVVTLMTIHASKGLEFNQVFVAGVTDGMLPHERSLLKNDELEEERRLMYVAMTRARQQLTLTFYGAASRFLYELPPELLDFRNLSKKPRNFNDDSFEDEDYIEYD